MNFFTSSEYLSNDFLHINNCGCQHFSGIKAGSRRLNGRIDYHILYISKGSCLVTLDGKETIVSENSLVFYPPHTPQIYSFSSEEESISYYIHFSGTQCENILKSLNLYSSRILNLGSNAHLENILDRLVGEFNVKKPFYEQCCCGLFINFLTAAARKNEYNISPVQSQNKAIYDICKIMHERYIENLTIAQYAKMANFSVGRFTHVFTQTIGISPKQYLLKIKLERASELISNTDLSIAQISDLVGISDSNYFSRLFKKYMGHTPGFYR